MRRSGEDYLSDMNDLVEVPLSGLTEGTVIEGDIYHDDVVLLRKGQRVTPQFIAALKKRNIETIKIAKTIAESLKIKATIDTLRSAKVNEKPSVADLAPTLYGNESEIWESVEIETAVPKRLLEEATDCVEDVFGRMRTEQNTDYEEVKPFISSIIESAIKKPNAAVKLLDVESHDQYTFRHSVNVGLIFMTLIKDICKDQNRLEDLMLGAVFHDIGKTKTPLEILNKASQLTNEEFEIIKMHPRDGFDILTRSSSVSDEAADIVCHHHEKWDGMGYPDKLVESQISELSQIAAVCDVYDALTTTRSYKPQLDFATAMDIIIKGSGKHFAPKAVNRLWMSLGLFPIGSFVKLSTGEVAVVCTLNPTNITRPVVALIYNKNHEKIDPPIQLDLTSDISVSITRSISKKLLEKINYY